MTTPEIFTMKMGDCTFTFQQIHLANYPTFTDNEDGRICEKVFLEMMKKGKATIGEIEFKEDLPTVWYGDYKRECIPKGTKVYGNVDGVRCDGDIID